MGRRRPNPDVLPLLRVILTQVGIQNALNPDQSVIPGARAGVLSFLGRTPSSCTFSRPGEGNGASG